MVLHDEYEQICTDVDFDCHFRDASAHDQGMSVCMRAFTHVQHMSNTCLAHVFAEAQAQWLLPWWTYQMSSDGRSIMVVRRLCQSLTLLVPLLVLGLAGEKETWALNVEAGEQEFEMFVRSLSACKTTTQGNGKRLSCITSQVCAHVPQPGKLEARMLCRLPPACMNNTAGSAVLCC